MHAIEKVNAETYLESRSDASSYLGFRPVLLPLAAKKRLQTHSTSIEEVIDLERVILGMYREELLSSQHTHLLLIQILSEFSSAFVLFYKGSGGYPWK
jgi:hypothetical protein